MTSHSAKWFCSFCPSVHHSVHMSDYLRALNTNRLAFGRIAIGLFSVLFKQASAGVEVGHAPGTMVLAEWLSKWRRQKNFDHRLDRQFLHLHYLIHPYLSYLIINPFLMKSRATFQASMWRRSWFSFFRLASAHRDVRRENTCHRFSLFTNQTHDP